MIAFAAGDDSWERAEFTLTILNDDPFYPSVPASVSAAPGDAEALITWASGGNGVNGTCATTKYYVTIYDAATWDDVETSEYIPQPDSGNPSWHVDELPPGTRYFAEIYAYGSACYNSSADPGEVYFTTTAANSGSDPTAPSGNKKKVPFPVRNLSVTVASSTTATATWTAARAGNGAKRCASASPQFHAYYVDNLTTGATDDDGEVVGEANASVTLTGLTAGHEYSLVVASWSSECGAWSKDREYIWTQ